MNHAFLILAHDSPELLQRIVDRLEAPNHYIFIHLDKKSNDKHIRITRGGYLSEDKRIKVFHGGFSMILAELALLGEAFHYDVNIDYFHLISGHDYPCVSNQEFDHYFEYAPQGRSYMHYDTDEQHVKWKEKIEQRVNRWHLVNFRGGKVISVFTRTVFTWFVPRKYEGELYAGWQWFSWHRSLVEWVLSYSNNHPEYLKRFHNTLCCDEVLFHTLLYPYIEQLNIEKNNALRYIDWSPKRPTKTLPLVLDERDYDSILSNGTLFCRKCFSDKSCKLLDMIDKKIAVIDK